MKYCMKCGTKLADDDLICGNCGVKQEAVEAPYCETPPIETSKTEKDIDTKTETMDAESISESDSLTEKTNDKRRKKTLILALGGIAIVCIVAILAIFLFGNSKGLVALDEVEQKLNEAYIKLWGDYDFDFDGVTEFEIENVDEDTHDQTFSCSIKSPDGVSGLRVYGLVKDGQVVQMQSVYFDDEEDFRRLDTDTQAALVALIEFPISIFKEDVDTLQEMKDFLFYNMVDVNNGTAKGDERRTVEGDIEYSYMGGSGKGVAIFCFNIRYLPAFSHGFFEDNNDVVG